jgi:hypothetical protein
VPVCQGNQETGDICPIVIRFAVILAGVCAAVALGSASAAPQAPGPVFSGNGDRLLPAFTVRVPSTLRWTTNGPIFQIFPRKKIGGGVNSTARSGATYLKPGTYRLEVNAYAAWGIRITGVEYPQPLGGGLVGFRGNGTRDLPPFTTRRGTNLIWTNSGAVFQVFSSELSLSIGSSVKRGKHHMDAGSHELTVNASGSWTIGWKP